MRENFAVKAHRKIVMRRRVQQISKNIAAILPDSVTALLDVGAGTGEMAIAVNSYRGDLEISGVDVYIRPQTFVPVVEYDGVTLPFEEGAFDAVMTVDVLHHCDDPVATLKECSRVAKDYVVIKDHISDSYLDEKLLGFMDWVGNRSHGVVLPYNYLSTAAWSKAIEDAGLELVDEVSELKLYPGIVDTIFGGSLHCLYLLKKVSK
jgi:SAM-dependent methyltransferase